MTMIGTKFSKKKNAESKRYHIKYRATIIADTRKQARMTL